MPIGALATPRANLCRLSVLVVMRIARLRLAARHPRSHRTPDRRSTMRRRPRRVWPMRSRTPTLRAQTRCLPPPKSRPHSFRARAAWPNRWPAVCTRSPVYHAGSTVCGHRKQNERQVWNSDTVLTCDNKNSRKMYITTIPSSINRFGS